MAQPLQRFDLQGLVAAIAHAQAEDRLEPTLSAAQWDALNGYLQPHGLVSGEVLFDRGAQDRTVFLVESGTLSVHLEDDKGRLKLAMIGPGGVVGEGAFFSHRPRSATVQANRSGDACDSSATWAIALPTPLSTSTLLKPPPAPITRRIVAVGARQSFVNFSSWSRVKCAALPSDQNENRSARSSATTGFPAKSSIART